MKLLGLYLPLLWRASLKIKYVQKREKRKEKKKVEREIEIFISIQHLYPGQSFYVMQVNKCLLLLKLV